MEPNYSRGQGRLSSRKRFRGIFWLFFCCHHCELSLWSTGSVHHSYRFLSGKNIATTFGRLFSMCRTDTPGTTNALRSLNQALMDHCSVFEWCIPWGRGEGGTTENYFLLKAYSRICFVPVAHKSQWKRIRHCTNQLCVDVPVFPFVHLYLL